MQLSGVSLTVTRFIQCPSRQSLDRRLVPIAPLAPKNLLPFVAISLPIRCHLPPTSERSAASLLPFSCRSAAICCQKAAIRCHRAHRNQRLAQEQIIELKDKNKAPVVVQPKTPFFFGPTIAP
jgi:hypothetical protein